MITPETARATYEWLCAFPPFNRWNLPPAKKLVFYTTDYVTEWAEFNYDKMTMRVSVVNVTTYDALIRALAHEAIHVREHVAGRWTVKHDSAFFKRCRTMVCKHWGFNEATF